MALALRPGDLARALRNPMVFDSALLFSKSVLAALTGTVFWLVAARLHSPSVIGVAGSLVSAGTALSFFSLLGLNYSVVKLLPRSTAPAADVLTSALLAGLAGLGLGCGYAAVVPHLSASLSFLSDPLVVVGFGVLVAGWTISLITDAAFLVLRWVPTNLAVNGVIAGVLRCVLPFVFVGMGALGLFVSLGLAMTIAGLGGLLVAVRRLPRPERWLRKPPEVDGLARFAGAGYATSVLDMAPQMLLPLIVVSVQGAYQGGLFYVTFQVATLLYALVMAVAMSMFAEGTRHPDRATSISRRAGVLLGGAVTLGVLVMIPLRGFLLSIFGSEYADRGGSLLVVLAVGALAFAFNNWVLALQRIRHLLRGSVVMQAVTCASVLAIAFVGAHVGTIWVAASWGIGQLLGGVVGYVDVLHDRQRRDHGSAAPAPTVVVSSPEAVR